MASSSSRASPSTSCATEVLLERLDDLSKRVDLATAGLVLVADRELAGSSDSLRGTSHSVEDLAPPLADDFCVYDLACDLVDAACQTDVQASGTSKSISANTQQDVDVEPSKLACPSGHTADTQQDVVAEPSKPTCPSGHFMVRAIRGEMQGLQKCPRCQEENQCMVVYRCQCSEIVLCFQCDYAHRESKPQTT